MSPTLYTAKNNGEENNGGNTTMVTTTTMANNGIGCGDIQSAFPSFYYEVDRWKYEWSWFLEEGDLLVMWWDVQGIA